jgi:hypothetical protein
MRNLVLACLFLAACGSDSTPAKMDGSGSAGTPDCATYCTKIQANCTAANAQYSSSADCMASCSHFTVGMAADTSGNTLGCRVYHAGNAMTDPTTHCVHAGPGGGGVCGTPCEGFCSLVTAECPTQYPSASTCATECAAYAQDPAYSASQTSGDTLACRLYHATAASTDPTTHCPHTAMVTTGGPCS